MNGLATMDPLTPLAAHPEPVTLWWRDDDAIAPSGALDRLTDLTRRHGVPLTLSVVPKLADPELPGAMAAHVSVFQHGWSHVNHGAPGAPYIELGGDRPVAEALGELAAGYARMRQLFGGRFQPVLVPPWHRIDDAVAERLPELGFTGLSAWAPDWAGRTYPGLARLDAHVNLIDRSGGRPTLADPGRVAMMLARALTLAPRGPIGILTHHLEHDEACWSFLEILVARLGSMSGKVRWIGAREALSVGGGARAA